MHGNTEYSDPPLSEGRGSVVVVLVIPIKYFFKFRYFATPPNLVSNRMF